ncbi:hypothetical protein CsatB_022308 [Cannabis sativa]|uniref:RING-type domain-containing protein n=1 Tax=Cannabis sativa TaxID=3483 RepID=A0A7J6F664_CANSA|nr:hypothetical protein F8388_014921 [Cannabis sativa]
MGLSNFPTAAEGVLPVLVMNSVLSFALLKNMLRSVLQVMGANIMSSPNVVEENPREFSSTEDVLRERRISITQFKSLCHDRFFEAKTNNTVECCVCLCRFEGDEEVSELSCKHFFHKGCLEKWFHNKHETCPLCRSID